MARPVGEVLAGLIDHLVGADRADQVQLVVLHTPVTSAPNACASCAAEQPHPAAAPMLNTVCPGCTFPLSRRACSAVGPEMGAAAACSKVRLAGLGTSPDRRTRTRRRTHRRCRTPPHPGQSGSGWSRPPPPARRHPGPGCRPGPAQPEAHDADQVRQAGHVIPDAGIHAGRAHPHQHLVVLGHRLVDLPDLRHLGEPWVSWTTASSAPPDPLVGSVPRASASVAEEAAALDQPTCAARLWPGQERVERASGVRNTPVTRVCHRKERTSVERLYTHRSCRIRPICASSNCSYTPP